MAELKQILKCSQKYNDTQIIPLNEINSVKDDIHDSVFDATLEKSLKLKGMLNPILICKDYDFKQTDIRNFERRQVPEDIKEKYRCLIGNNRYAYALRNGYTHSLLIPYQRFRDTHLAHHQDARLTDPYDDPESNYMDPAVWRALPAWRKGVLRANNTLLGRMLLGPIVGQIAFMHGDWQLIRARTPGVLAAWLWHIPALGVVLAFWAGFGQMPFWALALGSYGALAILKIRTFLEHRAHEKARARTVIVEDRGPLALLFLNNNLHVVHHAHPQVAWYRLPALYHSRKEAFLRRNEGYVYRSYGQIFRQYFLRGKDPVPHPLWPGR